MKYYEFDCGCSFPIIQEFGKNKFPKLQFKYPEDFKREECPAVWQLCEKGLTLGIFQLESNLGKHYCKELKPTCINHLAALNSILRPGCISGDTSIDYLWYKSIGGKQRVCYKKTPIKDLFTKFHRNYNTYNKTIVSLDETNNNLFNNKIKNVFYNGVKKVYRPIFKTRKIKSSASKYLYSLECTHDHKLLTFSNGWKPLCDIPIGERVIVKHKKKFKFKENIKLARNERAFQDICFYNYYYKCVFCNWNEGSLDVNHLEGNRKTNNCYKNLCFLCPNHHRLYSEGKITKEQIILAREKYKLLNGNYTIWAEYLGSDYVGEKDVYDIEVEGPNHNFIAGNVVVHNCLQAFEQEQVRNDLENKTSKSITQQYCDRKNGKETVVYPIKALEPILHTTYGLNIYQEQSIQIGTEIGGMTQSESDFYLRKSIGKKDAKLLFSAEQKFIDGAIKLGKVTEQEAKEIFKGIKASARYSFNKCIHPETLVKVNASEEIPIWKLNINDKILAPLNNRYYDTEYVKVVNIWKNVKPLVRVVFNTGKTIACSIEHKFYCFKVGLKPLWEIIANDYTILGHGYTYEHILSITPIGEQPTIDIEVDSPNHRFIGNNLIIGNSHSQEYGIRSFYDLYLKAHFPLHFYTAKLKSPRSGVEQVDLNNLIYEAKLFDIKTKLPDLRHCQPNFYNDGKSIYFGLTNIKGFGDAAFIKLNQVYLNNKKELVGNFFDFAINSARHLTPSMVLLLIESGAVDYFNLPREQMMEEYRLITDLTDTELDRLFKIYDAEKAGIEFS